MSDPQRKALKAYFDISSRNGASHVFRAATSLGFFESLASGQKEAKQIATECGTERETTRLILDAMCAIEVVEKYGDDYALAPVMQLLTEYDRSQGDEYWQYLADFARTGESPCHGPEADQRYRSASSSVQWINTPAALTVGQVLDIGKTRQDLRILDLGSATAVWSLVFLNYDPKSRATLIDTEEVLETANKMAEEIGIADRIETIAGDYRTVDLPSGQFDLVLLSNVCHLESDEGCANLLRRAHKALKPSGELVVIDVFPGQDEGQLQCSLFALGIALRTNRGRVRSVKQLGRLIADNGFETPTFAHLPDPPATRGVLVAKKN